MAQRKTFGERSTKTAPKQQQKQKLLLITYYVVPFNQETSLETDVYEGSLGDWYKDKYEKFPRVNYHPIFVKELDEDDYFSISETFDMIGE
jgi:hypothetical protein